MIQSERHNRFPILRLIGGLCFVLAGIAYYLGVTVSSSVAIVFVGAGVVVIYLGYAGHHANAGDVAIFMIGVLVLGATLSPGVGAPARGIPVATYTGASSALTAHAVMLLASTDVGNVDVAYSTKSGLGYQVNFTRTTTFPFWSLSGRQPLASLTNETVGGTFVLNATARGYDVSVLVGTGYLLSVNATTGTGNVKVRTSDSQSLGNVRLQSGLGNVDANLTCATLAGAYLQTGTGNVVLSSSHVAPSGRKVSVGLQTGTGGADLNVWMPSGTAASVTASTGLGSVSHDLPGFSVSPQSTATSLTATAGDVETASASFVFALQTGTGSVDAQAQFLG